MAADPLKKIQDLINLAIRSPFEEEARNCALQAVRLIREHGVQLTLAPKVEPPADLRETWTGFYNSVAQVRNREPIRKTVVTDIRGVVWTHHTRDTYRRMCGGCGGVISAGHPHYANLRNGFFHEACWESCWGPRQEHNQPDASKATSEMTDEDWERMFGRKG